MPTAQKSATVRLRLGHSVECDIFFFAPDADRFLGGRIFFFTGFGGLNEVEGFRGGNIFVGESNDP